MAKRSSEMLHAATVVVVPREHEILIFLKNPTNAGCSSAEKKGSPELIVFYDSSGLFLVHILGGMCRLLLLLTFR